MRSRAETLRIAQRLEDEHRQIRLSYRPALNAAHTHRSRPCADAIQESGVGRIAGRPGWQTLGEPHARSRRMHLRWWHECWGLVTLADFDGILPRVEEALRDLQARNCSGKTLANYAEALAAFCDWCVQREYLAADPLQSLGRFDTPLSCNVGR